MTLYEVIKKALLFSHLPTPDPAKLITDHVEDFIADRIQVRVKDPGFKEMQKLFEELTGRKVVRDE